MLLKAIDNDAIQQNIITKIAWQSLACSQSSLAVLAIWRMVMKQYNPD